MIGGGGCNAATSRWTPCRRAFCRYDGFLYNIRSRLNPCNGRNCGLITIRWDNLGCDDSRSAWWGVDSANSGANRAGICPWDSTADFCTK